ncbi:MAG: VWA domain-containing protein [Acidobacteriota bacterium]|nr:VWA domain-containing protein [Acidobacteriota bacterium]
MLKKFVVFLLAMFALVGAAAAQSGRRVQPTPSPTPAAVEEEESSYSESAPSSKPRRIYPPNWRNERSKSSKDKPATVKPQTQTVPNVQTGSGSSSTGTQTDATVDEADVIKVETNLISIPVSVFDRNGLYIPNLRQSDFKIFEDGREQEISYFGTSDKPFTVILLIDTSPSTQYKIEEIQQAATAFVDQLKPQDNVMVIEFDSRVNVLTEATNDRQKIYKAIRKADFGDGTSLYDAVEFSLRKRLSKIEGRKAIVLFTDGVDTTSYKANYDSTVIEAEEAETMIFPIYYNTFFDNRGGVSSPFPFPGQGGILIGRGNSAEDYALGKKYLEDLADATGGRVFRPEATPGGLTRAFEGIAEELRRQYNIGYYPQKEGKAGERRQIKVRVNRPNLVVRARDSYIVGAANNQTPASN